MIFHKLLEHHWLILPAKTAWKVVWDMFHIWGHTITFREFHNPSKTFAVLKQTTKFYPKTYGALVHKNRKPLKESYYSTRHTMERSNMERTGEVHQN